MAPTKHATYTRPTSVEQKAKDGGSQEANAIRAALLASSNRPVTVQRTKSAPIVNMSALAARRVVSRPEETTPEAQPSLDGPLSAARRSVDRQGRVVSASHDIKNRPQRKPSDERAKARSGSRDYLRPVPIVRGQSTSEDENAPRFAARKAFSHTSQKSEQADVKRQPTPVEGSVLAAQRVTKSLDVSAKSEGNQIHITKTNGHNDVSINNISLLAAKKSLPYAGSPSVNFSPTSSLDDLFDMDFDKSYGLHILSKSPPHSPYLRAHGHLRSVSPGPAADSHERYLPTAAINIMTSTTALGSDTEHTAASIRAAQHAVVSTTPKSSLSDEIASLTSPYLGPHPLPSPLCSYENRSSRSLGPAFDLEKSRATPESVRLMHDQIFASKAASRASSRNPSPARRTPLLSSARSHPISLRPTLRKEKDHEEKHKRRKVTFAERRRYEALFSSNKNESGNISGIVVKNLWTRSQLPQEMLEHTWDLVDTGQKGYLDREEFVVGVWSIDMALHGRKLPHKLDRKIWATVQNSLGVKIKRSEW